MWILILIVVTISFIATSIFLCYRIFQFKILRVLSSNIKASRIALAILFPALFFFIFCFLLNLINAIIIFLHLVIFWLMFDLVFFVIRKGFKRNLFKFDGILAIGTTLIYLSIAWYLANHVWITNYTIKTYKSISPLRIAMIADAHIGSTFNGEQFQEHTERIQEQNPDLVLICGDFVDDDTKRKDMKLACKALGAIESEYGIYFVFGNHDQGYYNYRDFTKDELKQELAANKIIVLEDEVIDITSSVYLIGRLDASYNEKKEFQRLEIDEIVKDLNQDKFMIVMNHQPNDFQNESEAGIDLVLCGHTHGGQLFPATYVGEWLGMNDLTYGYKKMKDTSFIVTSGISDWSICFKTGCKSEIVIIDIISNS